MKIKSRLSTIFSLFFVLIFFVFVSIYFAHNNINTAEEQAEIVSIIHRDIIELNTVTYEVLMQTEKRMFVQWHISYNSALALSKEVQGMFHEKNERVIARAMQVNLVFIEKIFNRLADISETKKSLVYTGTPEDEFIRLDSLQSRLISQLMLKLHSMSLDSQKLNRFARVKIEHAQYNLELTIVLSLLCFAVYLAFALFFINRSISSPLTKFVSGTEIIGSGNLDHEIDIKSKDEIGLLASKFNDMRLQLKESYGSLERKVRDKTSELEDERKSLEEKVRNRTSELQNMKDELEDKVNYRTRELKLKYEELARMNRAFVGRELKMVELKKEIKELKNRHKGT